MGLWRDRVAQPSGTPLRMVEVTLPADEDFLALARTSAMHVASLLLLPLERVRDLRLAVDEACSSFLDGAADENGLDLDAPPSAAPLRIMCLNYDLYPVVLHVTVCAAISVGWPHYDELRWAMLGALVDEVRASVEDGVGTLTLIERLPTAVDR